MNDKGRVIRLLVENRHRIHQQRIAEKTGWSKSKGSRVLSEMHDDGIIEKTSLGRENVITLTGDGGENEPDSGTRP